MRRVFLVICIPWKIIGFLLQLVPNMQVMKYNLNFEKFSWRQLAIGAFYARQGVCVPYFRDR